VSETSDDALDLHMVYNADLYRAETVARLMQDFVHLFEQFVSNADVVAGQFNLRTSQDKQWLPDLEQAIATQNYPGPVEQFLQHAYEVPDTVAIDYQGGSITYGQLETESRALAIGLHAAGAGIEEPVAILAQRTPSLVSALLGVLRSGATFMVLDSAYPVERLKATATTRPPATAPAGCW
jgi:non-ribosomal peptide synthetase component F